MTIKIKLFTALILAIIILCAIVILYFFGFREGSLPYLYNKEKSVYQYEYLYIDGVGVGVINFDKVVDEKVVSGRIIIGDISLSEIRQNCNFIVGINGSRDKDHKKGYFVIDKSTNHVEYGLTKDFLVEYLEKNGIAIDMNNKNTLSFSERKKLYNECNAK